MTVEIRIANNDDGKEWNAFISESPHGTLFHTWEWLKIAEKHTNMKLYPLIGIKHGAPIGVFPLFFQKKGPVHMVFSPPPHGALFYLGPVMTGYDTLKQSTLEKNYSEFQNSCETFIKNDLKAHYISISLPPTMKDSRPFFWSGYTIELYHDYVIDLSKGFDYLLQTYDKKQRQNLNRCKKRGITVEIGGKKELQKIHNMMEIRYAQQGKIETASKDYFLDIYDAYNDKLKIFVAKIDNDIVTGSIDFQYRDTHYSWIGTPKSENHVSPSPNDLLIAESVRYACEQGCKYYVTMSAAGNKRLHSYYASKFNPELSVRFGATKKTFVAGIVEKCYTDIIKPSYGRMNQLKSRNKSIFKPY